jgi:hypothetical protein
MLEDAMSIEAMKLALEALGKCRYRSLADEIVDPAITALRAAIAEAEKQEAWKTSDTAYRPEGLPQDFIKHEVNSASDWSEWVCPDPTQYFMKCCDCGLVHEMQFNVVKYSAGDKCEDVDDPYVQAVFRARRTIPPAAQPAPVQEPVAWLVEFENGEQELHFDKQSVGETQAPLYTTPPAQPCPYIRSTAEGTHHCALANQTKE